MNKNKMLTEEVELQKAINYENSVRKNETSQALAVGKTFTTTLHGNKKFKIFFLFFV